MCLSLMFARLGSVTGSNITAVLLENHCELVFYIPATCLLSKQQIYQ